MTSPLKLLGLDHVVLRVRDLEAALGFYVETLGCVEERRLDALGLVQLRAGAALIVAHALYRLLLAPKRQRPSE